MKILFFLKCLEITLKKFKSNIFFDKVAAYCTASFIKKCFFLDLYVVVFRSPMQLWKRFLTFHVWGELFSFDAFSREVTNATKNKKQKQKKTIKVKASLCFTVDRNISLAGTFKVTNTCFEKWSVLEHVEDMGTGDVPNDLPEATAHWYHRWS